MKAVVNAATAERQEERDWIVVCVFMQRRMRFWKRGGIG